MKNLSYILVYFASKCFETILNELQIEWLENPPNKIKGKKIFIFKMQTWKKKKVYTRCKYWLWETMNFGYWWSKYYIELNLTTS